MSRYPNVETLANRIFKTIDVSIDTLYQIHNIPANKYPLPLHKKSNAKLFYNVLHEFEENEIKPEEWIDLLTNLSKYRELKEKLIIDSYLVWNDFEELLNDHTFYLETDYFEKVSWNEGDGNADPPQINRLYILGIMVHNRKYLDVERWLLLKKYHRIYDDYDWERLYRDGLVGISLSTLDIKLTDSFEKIIQSIPTPGGATPLLDYYARGEHFAHEISQQSCKELFNKKYQNLKPNYVLTSSFMSALHALLITLATLNEKDKFINIGVVGKGVYFEVLRLFGLKDGEEIKKATLGNKFKVQRIEPDYKGKLDILYFEETPNSPYGNTPKIEDVIKLSRNTNCKVVITDITSNPFAFSETDIIKFSGLFIQLQSLAKYIQLGTNISMGGLAMFHQNKSKVDIQQMVKQMNEYITILGQHPDPNLAKAICRNPEILEKRLNRMKKNAIVFQKMLQYYSDRGKHWAVIDNESNTTNIIWIEVKKKWITRAKELKPASTPYGLYKPKYSKLNTSQYIKYILEAHLWQPVIGESNGSSPVVKTSFGFNQTTFHILDKGKIYIRISCGIESMELLRELVHYTISILGCDKDFYYYDTFK